MIASLAQPFLPKFAAWRNLCCAAGLLASMASPLYSQATYVAFPDTVERGEEIDVSILSENCPEGGQPLSGMKIRTPEGWGVLPETLSAGDCLLKAHLNVAENARIGAFRLWIEDDASNPEAGDAGTAEFEIVARRAGPIPPGLNPQVDIMWDVLPYGVTGDNFGSRVARRYYAVEVVIGNNTGYPLQLAGAAFENFKPNGRTNTALNGKIPVNSYQIVRGSLEREDQAGVRQKAIGALRLAGLLMTGFIPFYELPSRSKLHFTTATNIVNNPLVTGIQELFPPTTIDQLRRLDIQALRNGIIIPNNAQRRTLTFISKRQVFGRKDSNVDLKDPITARDALGQLTLVGHTVRHIERIQVTANPSGEVTPPPVVDALSAADRLLIRGAPSKTVSLTGHNLQGAAVESGDPEIIIESYLTTDDGNSVDVTLRATDSAQKRATQLRVSTSYGTARVEIEIVDPAPSSTSTGSVGRVTNDGASSVDITLEGAFLTDVTQLNAVQADGAVEVGIALTLNNQSADELTAALTVASSVEPGEYSLQIVHGRGLVATNASVTVLVTPALETVPALVADGTAHELELSGSNLGDVQNVELIDAQNVTVVFVAAVGEKITANFTAPTTAAGSAPVIVLDLGGGLKLTTTQTLEITAAP